MLRLKQRIACAVVDSVQRFRPTRVQVLGADFVVGPSVLNPAYFVTSALMADHLDVRPGQDVLDMGTGSGVQAIAAARRSCNVVAVDIDEHAVRCARENCRRNGLDGVVVMHGDLFEPLDADARFDRILFTPPYMAGAPRGPLAHALYDPDQSLLERFFARVRQHLKPEGRVQMLYSSIADHRGALRIATRHGFSHRVMVKKRSLIETFFIYELRAR